MSTHRATYDLVITGGRVMDPESGLDAIRDVGVRDGVIRAISNSRLTARATINALRLIVAPGFIDLNAHGHDRENYSCAALDGVTTSLALERGTEDVARWYAEREGRTLIHYGTSVGHMPVRMAVMHDPGDYVPSGKAALCAATDAEQSAIVARIARGLSRGALGVGLGIQYTPQATHWEILEVFRTAARHRALCYVHVRYAGAGEPNSSIRALEELIAAAAISGAPVQMTHVQSSGGAAVFRLLQMIDEARSRGLDVSVDFYPYTAAMTQIQSAVFDEGWQQAFGIDYGDLQWAATGERLTAQSFERYRRTGGWVIIHLLSEDLVQAAVASPLTMVATDGLLRNGKGHPRTAGTFARLLGRYVREMQCLTWMEALRKMTLWPARRLEARVPAMARKGRICPGADADLTLFDPQTVRDQATYREPALPSMGIRHVLVGGVSIVRDGHLVEDVWPGQPVRAPMEEETG